LADINSDGRYETMDVSIDDSTFGEGTLADGTVGANNDERMAGGLVNLGGFSFELTSDLNPAGDQSDVYLSSQQWFGGTASLEAITRSVVVADGNSDGIFERTYIDIENNGDFNGTGDASNKAVGATFQGALKLEYTLVNISNDGKLVTICPTGASIASTPSWYVGEMIVEGAIYDMAVSDGNKNGIFETADFDINGDSRLDDVSNTEDQWDTVHLGGVVYQVLNISDSGLGGARIIPYTRAMLGVGTIGR